MRSHVVQPHDCRPVWARRLYAAGHAGKRGSALYGVGRRRDGLTWWVCRQKRLGMVWCWPLARRLYTVSMSANAAWHCMALTVGAAALHGRTYRQTRLGTVWRWPSVRRLYTAVHTGKRSLALYGVGRRRGGFARPWIPANAAWHCMALAVGASALHGRTYRQTRLGTVWR